MSVLPFAGFRGPEEAPMRRQRGDGWPLVACSARSSAGGGCAGRHHHGVGWRCARRRLEGAERRRSGRHRVVRTGFPPETGMQGRVSAGRGSGRRRRIHNADWSVTSVSPAATRWSATSARPVAMRVDPAVPASAASPARFPVNPRHPDSRAVRAPPVDARHADSAESMVPRAACWPR
jgi:hypothetical protein